jgi:peptide/nickel transport system substrate-binding protein
VTADDVVASLMHHRGEDSKSAAKSLLKEIVTLKADGADTVVFELSGGNADFPYTVSDYHMPIMPKKDDGSVDWESGIRTGAYKLEKFQPGVQASFTKNENYYKPNRGWFDTVQFLSIKDVAARTNALLSGEIHYMDRCDLKTLDMLKSNPDSLFRKSPAMATTSM